MRALARIPSRCGQVHAPMSRLFAWAGAGLCALTAALYAHYRRPLPRTQGRLELPGLRQTVEVVRDARGIPTLRANCWADAWRALGWVHAQDRPFQMDLQRRMASGRLSEVLGSRALRADRFLRRHDLQQAAGAEWNEADADERSMLTAYAEGVNACWKSQARASEFVWLGYRPENWTPVDSFLWVKGMAHDLASNWEHELIRTWLLLQGVGLEQLALLSLHPPAGMPELGPTSSQTRDSVRQLLSEYQAVRDLLPEGFDPGHPLGSNAWAVDGRHSASGYPLLANDPHLAMKVPDFWYQVGIQVDGQTLMGASMPGLPGVILGQNGQLAWGVTNAYIDVQDLFLEQVDWQRQLVVGPDGPEELQVRSHWLAGQPYNTYLTPRGPLLSGSAEHGPWGLSLAWSGRAPGHFFRALDGLHRATSLDDARRALADWHLPVLNFILAGRQGIAHQVGGRLPRRRAGSGLVVAPAWEAQWAWKGSLGYKENPATYRPESGRLVSANHSVQAHHGQFLSWDFNPGFRAERIEEMLAEQPHHSLESFARIQLDQGSTLARRMLGQLQWLQAHRPLARQALNLLRNWNGQLSADSAAACIYSAWLNHLCDRMVLNLVGEECSRFLLGKASFHPLDQHPSLASRLFGSVVLACCQRDPSWLRPGQSWEQHLQGSFESALQGLKQRLGGEPSSWAWGRLHRLHISHPLGKLGPLFPHLGPYPVGGDAESPNQTGYASEDGLPGAIHIGASWRFLCDTADFTLTQTAHCPGQSGHPGSRHYADGLADWLAGRYHQPLRARPRAILQLEPAGNPESS